MGSKTTNGSSSGISRRTVVAGAAWAVPVVAIAPAARAATCSDNVCVTYSGIACKVPGASGGKDEKKAYKYNFTMLNETGDCVTVFFYSFSVNGAAAPDYLSIQSRLGGITSSCGGCSDCFGGDAETWAQTHGASLPNAVWPTKAGKTPPNDYFTYHLSGPGGGVAIGNSYTCVGTGASNQLDVWVVAGEYPSSAEGNNAVIRWIVFDKDCNIIQTNSVNPTDTPPNCV